jgi:hypothetical protein
VLQSLLPCHWLLALLLKKPAAAAGPWDVSHDRCKYSSVRVLTAAVVQPLVGLTCSESANAAVGAITSAIEVYMSSNRVCMCSLVELGFVCCTRRYAELLRLRDIFVRVAHDIVSEESRLAFRPWLPNIGQALPAEVLRAFDAPKESAMRVARPSMSPSCRQ